MVINTLTKINTVTNALLMVMLVNITAKLTNEPYCKVLLRMYIQYIYVCVCMYIQYAMYVFPRMCKILSIVYISLTNS